MKPSLPICTLSLEEICVVGLTLNLGLIMHVDTIVGLCFLFCLFFMLLAAD